MKRLILGIDPGTTITGYGIILCKGKKMELITSGIIRLGKQKVEHPEKLKKIFQRVSSLVVEFKPTEMALEAPFYGKNVQSMLKLGRAQGVAMAAGLQYGLPIFEYAPKKVKQSITGRGNASKEQVAKMLETLLKLETAPETFDASDGLAVAVCHFFQSTSLLGNQQKHKGWEGFIKANPKRIKRKD